VDVKGLLETSFLDWPGQVAAVVFLGGCNLRCPFCHNRELVLEHQRLPGRTIEAVLDSLEDCRDWLDGLVVSGGEPTLAPDLAEMCRIIRARGLAVKLDTNGTRPRVLEELISAGLIQAAAMDHKAPLAQPDLHRQMTGLTADLGAIRASLNLLLAGPIEAHFRTTVVPGLLGEAELKLMAQELRGAQVWRLNAFRPQNCLDPEFCRIKPLEKAEMDRLQGLAEGWIRE